MGCKNSGGNGNSNNLDYHRDSSMHHGMGLMSAAAAAAAHQAAMQYHRFPTHPHAMMNQSHQLHQPSVSGMNQYGMINNSANNNNIGLPPRQPHHLSNTNSSTSHTVWNDPMSAAQSLTFLKRGSPIRSCTMGVSPITKSPGTSSCTKENIPSLTSSSESDSPAEGGLINPLRMMSTPESFRGENSALLLAAVAMTEFGQSPPPTSSMLSPDFIRTYNTGSENDNNDDEDDENTIGQFSPTPKHIDDTTFKSEQQQHSTSKRNLKFDDVDIPDRDANGTVPKKLKSLRR
jgi:hypothetical protein